MARGQVRRVGVLGVDETHVVEQTAHIAVGVGEVPSGVSKAVANVVVVVCIAVVIPPGATSLGPSLEKPAALLLFDGGRLGRFRGLRHVCALQQVVEDNVKRRLSPIVANCEL